MNILQEEFRDNFARNLRLWRKAHDIDPQNLAESIGCATDEIIQFENGLMTSDLIHLIRIAHVLCISLDHLLFFPYPAPTHYSCSVSCMLYGLLCKTAKLCTRNELVSEHERVRFRRTILRMTDLLMVQDGTVRQGHVDAIVGFIEALHDHVFHKGIGRVIRLGSGHE